MDFWFPGWSPQLMRHLFTTFLTVIVLVHAIFGCCIHHAHACEARSGKWHQPSSGTCDHDDHGQESHQQSLALNSCGCDEQHQHDGPLSCDDDKCIFTRTESSPNADTLSSQNSMHLFSAMAPSLSSAVELATASHPPAPDAAFTGLRLHLALEVLVI